MATMKRTEAIKKFFEREDSVSPNGGRKVTVEEFKPFMKDKAALQHLAEMAATELGVTLES